MSMKQDPQEATGPEPVRRAYADGAYSSEEHRAQPDGTENVGANYSPGTVRTTGNVVLGIVALVAVAILIALYVIFVAVR